MGLTIRQLRGMTDEEVMDAYDVAARYAGEGIAFFADELQRRDSVRSDAKLTELTASLESLTKWVAWLSGAALVVGAAALAVAIFALVHR